MQLRKLVNESSDLLYLSCFAVLFNMCNLLSDTIVELISNFVFIYKLKVFCHVLYGHAKF